LKGTAVREPGPKKAPAQKVSVAGTAELRFSTAVFRMKFHFPAVAARELRNVRADALPKLKGGLRALDYTLELPGANPLKDAA